MGRPESGRRGPSSRPRCNGLGRSRAAPDEQLAGLPLFLYVRPDGGVLATLSTAVKAALTSTQNLNEDSVRALCRSGLVALFIDGFDELLGSVGYPDAIGSIRPWIVGLGGRGALVLSARSSYFLNQYRTSVDRELADLERLSVEHKVAEIQLWTDPEVDRYLLDGYALRVSELAELSQGDRKLLRLPFFSRVLGEAYQSDPALPGLAEARTLPKYLVEQYVAREEIKLRGSDSESLVTRDELQRVFEYVADEMAGKDDREVTVEDLETAAELALPAGALDVRKGLRGRLSVLCGLAMSGSDVATRRFGFQHEVFYDVFLASLIIRFLGDGDESTVRSMMRQAQWRQGTVDRLVDEVPAETLERFLRNGPTRNDVAERHRATFAANKGAVWSALAGQRRELSSGVVIEDAFFEELDLTDVVCPDLCLRQATIQHLVLPPVTPWHLRLEDSVVSQLKLSSQTRLEPLSGLQVQRLMTVETPSVYADGRTAVVDACRGLGVRHRLTIVRPQDRNLYVEAAEYFLDNITAKAEIGVVVRAASHQPEDNRLKWIKDYEPDLWKRFVKTLEEFSLVSFDPLATRGGKKLRLRFQTSPSTIRERSDTLPEINEFWRRLSEQT